jgi:hypothetical protein
VGGPPARYQQQVRQPYRPPVGHGTGQQQYQQRAPVGGGKCAPTAVLTSMDPKGRAPL